jgi:hypothetical protein
LRCSNVKPALDEFTLRRLERIAFYRSGLRRLNGECLRHVMSFLGLADLRSVSRSCDALKRVVGDAVEQYWVRQDLVCFHSKKVFEEDMLGVGLSLENYSSGEIAYIHPHLDLISKSAFNEEKIRRGVWKQSFTHWVTSLASTFDSLHAQRCSCLRSFRCT